MKVAAETGRRSVQPTPWFQPGLALCSGWAEASQPLGRPSARPRCLPVWAGIQFLEA